MPLLWTVPALAMVAAMVIVLTQLRHITAATVALHEELQRVDDVRTGLLEVRTASAEARTTLRRLRGA